MTCVEGCPVISLPHRHRNWSLSVSVSIVKAKRACFFRSFISLFSDTSFPMVALVAPLSLLALGAMTTRKRQDI